MKPTAESQRLDAAASQWKQWGPYLSERAWGTVREDYSPHGEAWDYLPHDHARSRAYRWNEDGLAGISDSNQYLCFALALWNGKDAILKERLFGLTGKEGNHGEDVKEYYYYLDSTPTHSYMKMLYKYPQAAFPYSDLVAENRQRDFGAFEYELMDTGVFEQNRYFDVLVEYAKADTDDILVRISITNHADEAATIHTLPTLWFRNTWSWGYETGPMKDIPYKPKLTALDNTSLKVDHPQLEPYYLYAENPISLLFTENDTNNERLFGVPNNAPYVKDAFHRYVVQGNLGAVNPEQTGTKACALYRLTIAAGQTEVITLRLTTHQTQQPFANFDAILQQRIREADEFYDALHSAAMGEDEKRVQRQALAGMLWSKQLYYYDVEQWLDGDPIAPPPEKRKHGRNHQWKHLNNFDIISMPDKWEYPWYAGWDLGFHCIPLAMVDVHFAKHQLILLTQEWFMHPNGQLPAYEWAFSDVNPPIHAWAAWHVYEMDGKQDKTFLKRIFHKMLLNFTWWVNRKDADGNNVFQGGFLGLDNISIFDRSASLPTGGHIDQSDGTAWMGFYCLVMLNMAIELSEADSSYQDLAVKFYEHFLWIAQAISGSVRQGVGLWDDEDGFFYDVLRLPDHTTIPLKVRSLVGLMPLIAVETVNQEKMHELPRFEHSVDWLTAHRPVLADNLAIRRTAGYANSYLFAMPTADRLRRVLRYMLDEDEFLSPYGIRSLSKIHEKHPYRLNFGQDTFSIEYWAAESKSGLFGGNSNWRGPIWFPINYLLIEALLKYHSYYGDDFTVECPTGSGNFMTLQGVATELSQRLMRLFLRDVNGNRPVFGGVQRFQQDPAWCDYIAFHEYFHGDNGAGLGASHQTGWTGLVAELLQRMPLGQ
jgi:hypothetical protein